jgi:hypothetical protein
MVTAAAPGASQPTEIRRDRSCLQLTAQPVIDMSPSFDLISYTVFTMLATTMSNGTKS